jgi:hypothetical protein
LLHLSDSPNKSTSFVVINFDADFRNFALSGLELFICLIEKGQVFLHFAAGFVLGCFRRTGFGAFFWLRLDISSSVC